VFDQNKSRIPKLDLAGWVGGGNVKKPSVSVPAAASRLPFPSKSLYLGLNARFVRHHSMQQNVGVLGTVEQALGIRPPQLIWRPELTTKTFSGSKPKGEIAYQKQMC
jgi:hypothetical protein